VTHVPLAEIQAAPVNTRGAQLKQIKLTPEQQARINGFLRKTLSNYVIVSFTLGGRPLAAWALDLE
jgi:hypothetical protein